MNWLGRPCLRAQLGAARAGVARARNLGLTSKVLDENAGHVQGTPRTARRKQDLWRSNHRRRAERLFGEGRDVRLRQGGLNARSRRARRIDAEHVPVGAERDHGCDGIALAGQARLRAAAH